MKQPPRRAHMLAIVMTLWSGAGCYLFESVPTEDIDASGPMTQKDAGTGHLDMAPAALKDAGRGGEDMQADQDLSAPFVCEARVAQGLCLDASFGQKGIFSYFLGQAKITFSGQTVAYQRDGKILLALPGGAADNTNFVALRLLENGDRDETFGLREGRVEVDVGADDKAAAIALREQPEGVLLAGRTGGNASFVALTPEGSLDPSFGQKGSLILPLGAYEAVIANGLLVDSAGKDQLVFSGQGMFEGKFDALIGKVDFSGSLIQGFGQQGQGWSATGAGNDKDEFTNTLYRANDGKFLVTGSAYVGGGREHDCLVIRYKGDGTLDSDFANQGVAYLDIAGGTDRCVGLAFSRSGHIIVGGLAQLPSGSQAKEVPFLAVLTPDGQLDQSIGNGGKVLLEPLAGDRAQVWSLTTTPDDRLIVTGEVKQGTSSRAFVALFADQSLATWSHTILDPVDPQAGDERAFHVSIDRSARLMLLGISGVGENQRLFLRRFLLTR